MHRGKEGSKIYGVYREGRTFRVSFVKQIIVVKNAC